MEKFRWIVRLTKSEFLAEVDNMPAEERHFFDLWLRHEDDQRYAKVVQTLENYDEFRKAGESLLAHGLGTPGKDMFRDVVPLLSPEDRAIIAKLVVTLVTDGIWRAALQENESA